MVMVVVGLLFRQPMFVGVRHCRDIAILVANYLMGRLGGKTLCHYTTLCE